MKANLQDLSSELNHNLKKLCVKKSYSAGERVFSESDQATFLPIVFAGKVKMVRYPEPGKELIIGTFDAGEIFAIPPALDGKQFPATAVAMDHAQIMFLPRKDFLKLMEDSTEFSGAVTNTMCGLLRTRTEKIQVLATPSSEQRITSVLLQIVEQNGGNLPTKITLRRQDIAEMASLTIETTIRTIRILAKKELLKIVRGKIVIDDTNGLKSLFN